MTATAQARYQNQARIIKALAHPTRLFIVDELARGKPWPPPAAIGSGATTRRVNLKTLITRCASVSASRWRTTSNVCRSRCFSRCSSTAGKFPGERGMEIGSLIRIALNAGAEQLFREEMPLQAGDLLRLKVIDVREKDERDTGYIPGSRNVPYRLLGTCCPDLAADLVDNGVTLAGGGAVMEQAWCQSPICAPSRASRAASCPAVSFAPTGVVARWRMSPLSMPASIFMMVTPVSASPFRMAHWIGAAPRYLGRRDV